MSRQKHSRFVEKDEVYKSPITDGMKEEDGFEIYIDIYIYKMQILARKNLFTFKICLKISSK